jgi:hypothetical protein
VNIPFPDRHAHAAGGYSRPAASSESPVNGAEVAATLASGPLQRPSGCFGGYSWVL